MAGVDLQDSLIIDLDSERIRRYLDIDLERLVSDVRDYISACQVCKSTKAPNFTVRPLGKAPESQRFFQRLFIDFLGPYPRSRSDDIGLLSWIIFRSTFS